MAFPVLSCFPPVLTGTAAFGGATIFLASYLGISSDYSDSTFLSYYLASIIFSSVFISTFLSSSFYSFFSSGFFSSLVGSSFLGSIIFVACSDSKSVFSFSYPRFYFF
jgi:hypothetical protein